MKRLKNPVILIAGSGNTTGVNVIKALLNEYRVIGSDYNYINAANKICRNIVVSPANHKNYSSDILKIIDDYDVTHIISTNDHDTRTLLGMHDIFVEKGVIHNGYCSNALALLDKELTTELFRANNIRTPMLLSEHRLPFVLRKKEMGSKSKFLYIAKDETDIEKIPIDCFDNGIITEFVEGVEFTIDVLCNDESDAICVIPRQRLEVKGGMVWHGKISYEEALIDIVKSICKKLRLVGIMCLQCLKTETNEYTFIEINPRAGSGIDLSVNGGCNLPALWVKSTINTAYEIPSPDWGLEMIRYNSAYFFHA